MRVVPSSAGVAGDGRDRQDVEFGPDHGQGDGQRVVMARVAVEDDPAARRRADGVEGFTGGA